MMPCGRTPEQAFESMQWLYGAQAGPTDYGQVFERKKSCDNAVVDRSARPDRCRSGGGQPQWPPTPMRLASRSGASSKGRLGPE